MNIKLENLTLKQMLDVERCVYNSDYEFTDDQFRDFINQQIEFGLDPMYDLKLQEDVVYIYDRIYFFDELIRRGEFIEL